MKKVLCCLFFSVALFSSCSKEKDLFDINAVESQRMQNAEKELGVTIDPNQTWIMTETRTVNVESLPSDMEAKYVLVMDANPLKDKSAEVLAVVNASNKTISFEAPKGLTTLFAVCVDEVGDVRVRELDASKSVVSFVQDADYQVVSATASARRNRAPENRSIDNLVWQNTVHSDLFASDGWEDQWAYVERGDADVHFDDITNYIDIVLGYLPEGGLNFRDTLNKAEMVRNNYYAVVGEGGGEVTLTALYRNTINPNSRFGYYYFEPGDEQSGKRNIKTVRKFVFEDEIPMNYHNVKRDDIAKSQTVPAYKLVYYDKDGNPSYHFPEGTEIGLFINVDPRYAKGMDKAFNWYNEGTTNNVLSAFFKNQDVLPSWAKSYNVSWETFSHTVMFERGGTKFVCFEDWVQDFDMNDIVLMIDGNIEDVPVAPTGSCKEDIRFYRFSYGFEDTYLGDYDMNDVVLRVWRQSLSKNSLQIELAACGANDEIYMFYTRLDGDTMALFEGKEAHQLFVEAGNAPSQFYNTETINAPLLPLMTLPMTVKEFEDFNYNKADFFIYNATKDLTIHIPAAMGVKGSAPYGICTPQKAWKWPKERTAITKAYNPYFAPFAANQDANVDWYLFPVEELVMYYDTAK